MVIKMEKTLEIEFKNALTESEYEALSNKYNFPEGHWHENYYFDTVDHKLASKKQVLRIRKKSNGYELTLKTPNPKGGNDEYSEIISEGNFSLIYQTGVTPQVFGIKDKVKFITSVKTLRKELTLNGGLFSLDFTVFKDQTTDYELEMEYSDVKKGQKIFLEFLEENSIKTKQIDGKTKRAFKKLSK